ncbi:MAG: ATP-binding cassette domain-containing protein [Bacteroidetes bacterium]|jgi:phospholipid/cholesterol/gamma-HCH transport system ATP-binding protein|nr:ATP-binding cassette domain-containing protein [Bacteroidota bacterium]MBT6686669.1 ATP-binding cassette domain-containing protein [Bacteroidota bacterium]MBT7144089.1 ATP-binding cassette domain-containing protein [Bacteroidota bacterium]MBT7492268.1 ATP-binding cassette domain-containing protein [Bacteroidota bacterium]
MIRLKNISKSFDDKKVLSDINVEFASGKTNLVIGQSGSGKTVLIKSMVGLFEIDEGEITYNDRNFTKMNFRDKKSIRKEIGMVFQGGALFDSSTVEENIMFPLDLFTNMNPKEKLDRVNFCLERVNISKTNMLYPSEISGGMKKRVAIARAISLNPKYLFFDEPNSGLDPYTSIVIDNLIKEITEEFNTTTVINTHDMNSVLEIGDKIVFIYKGKKWWEGSNTQVFSNDNKELNDFVFASKLSKNLRM